MRRENIDLSYKKTTADIVKKHFFPWQNTYKNIDLSHELINLVHSICLELVNEAKYVEAMYMPDVMDVNEEWLVYELYTTESVDNLKIDGIAFTEKLQKASSIDEFIAGPYDLYKEVSSESTTDTIIHIANYNFQKYILTPSLLRIDNALKLTRTNINIYNEETITINKYIDYNHRDIGLDVVPDLSTLSVTIDDIDTHYNLTVCDSKIEFNEELDLNGDGIISNYELMILDQIRGKSKYDLELEQWKTIMWADINNNGVIDENDYRYISMHVGSTIEEYKAFITLPANSIGQCVITYKPQTPKAKFIIPTEQIQKIIQETDTVGQLVDKITLDHATNIYYGINYTNNALYAITLYDNFDVKTYSRLNINTELQDHRLIDCALFNGYLFVLTKYEDKYYIISGDARLEYLEYIDHKATITLNNTYDIIGFYIDDSGSFYLYTSNRVIAIKAYRNKYVSINNKIYTNIKYNITDGNNKAVKILPWNIFNSFDAIAYNFGLTRPYGINNISMKKLIFDIWKHRTENNAIGINYGLKRALGFENTYNSYYEVGYKLPSVIDTTSVIKINNNIAQVTDNSSYKTLSTIEGDFKLYDDMTLIVPENIYDLYNEINISGMFYNLNGYTQPLDYDIVLKDKHTYPDIEIYTINDELYKQNSIYPYTEEDISDIISSMEEENPYILKNIIIDATPIHGARIPAKPILPIKFNPSVDTSNYKEIEL